MNKLKVFSAIVIAVIMVFSMAASVVAEPVTETATLTNITQINEAGFGTPANKYAFAMAEYEGDLYVGTLNIKKMPGMARFFSGTTAKRASEGAEIWRYHDGQWTQVVDAGLNSYLNLGVRKMVPALGCLFGVTANHDEGMEVWRTCDGENWEVVADKGFGNPDNSSGRGLGFFNGYLYAGTENRIHGAELYRSVDGLNWEKVAQDGILDKRNMWLSDFAELDGYLYMGTLNVKGMQLYRTKNGTDFEQVFKGGLEKFTNTAAMKVYVYNDELYVTTMDLIQGYDLYVSSDGLNFERLHKRGHTKHSYAYLWQLEEYNGRLYAGTYQHRGLTVLPNGRFSLLSSQDGRDWIVENDNALGNPWYYGVRTFAVWDGKLVIGTASARYGCKVYTLETK